MPGSFLQVRVGPKQDKLDKRPSTLFLSILRKKVSLFQLRFFTYSRLLARKYKRPRISGPKIDAATLPGVSELGWKLANERKTSRKSLIVPDTSEDDAHGETPSDEAAKAGMLNRRQLLKELSARLARDTQLRYAEREFEMQRLMMGKGGRKKLKAAERMEGDDEDDEEDEDEIDARRGKRTTLVQKVDEKTYKPRVYKWRLERKR